MVFSALDSRPNFNSSVDGDSFRFQKRNRCLSSLWHVNTYCFKKKHAIYCCPLNPYKKLTEKKTERSTLVQLVCVSVKEKSKNNCYSTTINAFLFTGKWGNIGLHFVRHGFTFGCSTITITADCWLTGHYCCCFHFLRVDCINNLFPILLWNRA